MTLFRGLNGGFTEATFPLLESQEGAVEFGFVKIGPEGGGDINFAIGHLPQQKITQAHFTAGTDQKIGIRDAVGIKVIVDQGFIDIAGSQFPAATLVAIARQAWTNSWRPP